MDKLGRKFLIFTMIVAVSFQSVSVSMASVYNVCGLKSKNTSVSDVSGFSKKWASVINNAIKAWNDSGAGVKLNQSSNPYNKIKVGSYTDSWYGMTSSSYEVSTGYINEATIKINDRTISKDASNFSKFAQSTVAHEIGQLYWLDDNPVDTPAGYNMSLMNHGRNRNTIYEPQAFDVSNVKRKYSCITSSYNLSDNSDKGTINLICIDEPEYNMASKLVNASELLVSGTVVAQKTKMLEMGADKEMLPYTIYEIEIKDKYKGDCSGTIYARRLGGKTEDTDNILSGANDINVGESYVFALKDYGNGDYGFVNTTQSAFALKKAATYKYGAINRKDVLALADKTQVRNIAADEKIYGTEKELKKASDMVLFGDIIDYSYKIIDDNLYTIWKLEVHGVKKGKKESDIIYIKVLGGRTDTFISLVSDMTKIECGNAYMFYLKDYGEDYYGLTNYSESVIKLGKMEIQ